MSKKKRAEIDWTTKDTKRQNDRITNAKMAETLIDKKNINVLSFPAKLWIWERRLAEDFDGQAEFHFVGLEHDPEDYEIQRRNMLSMSLTNATFNTPDHASTLMDFASEPWEADPFDIVYADWMGTWDSKKKEEVRLLFENKLIADDGFLQITICVTRGNTKDLSELRSHLEHGGFYELLDFSESDLDDKTTTRLHAGKKTGLLKTYGLCGLISSIAGDYDQSVRLLNLSIYDSPCQDRKGYTTPEISLLFRVSHNKS
jgi:hypothetical protein